MKAIIEIGYTKYLVPDARKALAFVEMMQKSQEVAQTLSYEPDQIRLSGEPVRAEMRVVPATTKIVPAKKCAAKKTEDES
jgi:hypothetical protein